MSFIFGKILNSLMPSHVAFAIDLISFHELQAPHVAVSIVISWEVNESIPGGDGALEDCNVSRHGFSPSPQHSVVEGVEAVVNPSCFVGLKMVSILRAVKQVCIVQCSEETLLLELGLEVLDEEV